MPTRKEIFIQIFNTTQALVELSTCCDDDEVKAIIGSLITSLESQGFDPGELLQVYQLNEEDSLALLADNSRFDVSTNSGNGVHFNQPEFHPQWEYIFEYQHWYEILVLRGDDGFGNLILIPKAIRDQELLTLCQMHSTKP